MEEGALVRNLSELIQIALERIRRIEVMRRLHESEAGIAHEPPKCHLQKRPRRHVIRVEDGDELPAYCARARG